MPLDPSIYQNQPQTPTVDPITSAERAMSLGQMGLQMQTQQAMKQAYANNTDETGKLNQQGFISEIGKVNPQAAMQYGKQFADMQKQQAETHLAQLQDLHQTVVTGLPHLEYALNFARQNPDKPEQVQEMWTNVRKTMASQGLPINNLPEQFNEKPIQYIATTTAGHKEALDNALTKANIDAKKAETGNVAANRLTDYQKMYNSDDVVKKSNDIISGAKSGMALVDDAVKNKSPMSRTALLMTIAKTANDGQPFKNQEGMEEYIKGLPAGDRLKEAAGKILTGKLDADTADYVRQFLAVKSESAAKTRAERAADIAAQHSQDTNSPFDESYRKITGMQPGTLAQTPGGPAKYAKNKTSEKSGGGGFGLIKSADAAEKPTTPNEDNAAITWAQGALKDPNTNPAVAAKAARILKLHGVK